MHHHQHDDRDRGWHFGRGGFRGFGSGFGPFGGVGRGAAAGACSGRARCSPTATFA